MPKVVNIEPTPNPDAMKFVVRGALLASGARAFRDFEAAVGDPLASALFALGRVTSVFYMRGFVTVNKAPEVDWSDLIDDICEVVEGWEPPQESPGELNLGGAAGDSRFARILDLLDTRIRPALAGDGGGLEVVSFENDTLSIAYQGACGSCPAAATGTRHFIEALLQDEVDPGIRVVIC